MTLEERVQRWIVSRIGAKNAAPKERAMRVLEEAMELAQAHGITQKMATRQLEHVYARNPGSTMREGAQVAVCLFGWCAGMGVELEALAVAEIDRIEAKPADDVKASLARKLDAGVIAAVEE